MRLPSSPTLALAVGALGSGAANVAWTWEHGPVRVIAGLFATALVPISLHLWPQVPITGKATRLIRALVMTYICVAAAIVNLSHAVLLLTTPQDAVAPPAASPGAVPWPWEQASGDAENVVLALLLITAVEAVMIMATLARRTPQRRTLRPEQQVALLLTVAQLAAAGRKRPPQKPRPRRENPSVARPRSPARPVTSIDQSRDRRAAGMAWARANWPVSGGQIATKVGVSRSEGDRIRKWVKEEKEQAS